MNSHRIGMTFLFGTPPQSFMDWVGTEGRGRMEAIRATFERLAKESRDQRTPEEEFDRLVGQFDVFPDITIHVRGWFIRLWINQQGTVQLLLESDSQSKWIQQIRDDLESIGWFKNYEYAALPCVTYDGCAVHTYESSGLEIGRDSDEWADDEKPAAMFKAAFEKGGWK